jgi:hypothetical protein
MLTVSSYWITVSAKSWYMSELPRLLAFPPFNDIDGRKLDGIPGSPTVAG